MSRARSLLLALLLGALPWVAAQQVAPPTNLTPAPQVEPVIIKSLPAASPATGPSTGTGTVQIPATPQPASSGTATPAKTPGDPAPLPSAVPNLRSPQSNPSQVRLPESQSPSPASSSATGASQLPGTDPVVGTTDAAGLDQPDTGNNDPTEHEKAGHCVEGSEQACMALSRQGKDGKERRILVVRTGTSDDTGIYTVCGPRDDEPADSPNIGVFSEAGPGGIRITIDKNVIRVPLAVVTQRPPKEGQDGSDGRVEASAGTAKFLDQAPTGAKDRLSLCGVESLPKPVPNTVYVTQGKTRLRGQKLVYDETDGVAHIDGPITFRRDNDKDPLSGSSQSIEVNVDDEKTVLVGDVVLRSKGGRVSKAARVEYDDAQNEARLYATKEHPAESVKGTDVLRLTDGLIVYNLDTNDVYVSKAGEGNITAEFEDSGDTNSTSAASTTGSAADPHKSPSSGSVDTSTSTSPWK